MAKKPLRASVDDEIVEAAEDVKQPSDLVYFVAVVKDGEQIEVSNAALAQHIELGWAVA
jgi:hypothetical protein